MNISQQPTQSYSTSLGLRGKSILFLLTLFIFVGGLSIFGIIYFSRELALGLDAEIAEGTVLLNRQIIQNAIQNDLKTALLLAKNSQVVSWLEDENNASKQTTAIEQLNIFSQQFSSQSYFVASQKSGHLFVNDKQKNLKSFEFIDTLSRNDADDNWFFDFLERDESYQFNVDFNSELQTTKLWVNVIVKDKEKNVGVIGSGVELTSVVKDFINDGNNAHLPLLVDKDGVIQAISQNSSIIQSNLSIQGITLKTIWDLFRLPKDKKQMQALFQRAKAQSDRAFTETIEINGHPTLISISYLSSMGWYNVLIIDSYHVVTYSHITTFIALFILAFSSIALMLWFALNKRIVNPILAIDEAAKEIEKGHYDFSVPVVGYDEISHLALSFERMRSGIYERAVHLKQQMKIAEDLAQQAQSVNLAKSQFLSNMSHEFKTPMNGIVGMIELLKTTELTDEQLESIESMSECSQSLLMLIDEVLDYAKIDSGTLVIENAPFEVKGLIYQTVSRYQEQANRQQIPLEILVDHSIPKTLIGSERTIQQVLSNLVNNALKFTEKGQINIEVVLQSVTDGVYLLKFIVLDTGLGIDSEETGQLFEPFVQLDNSLTRQHEGAGLGLAICKQLVQQMGGEIGILQNHPHGTLVWFSLPLRAFDLH
ncbi:MAG: hypothetical protein COW84_10570 [Gammaproteobacteria bacterium CG22_combo_CG10-13_8_21_14_all_40_8]|nr:MAG: hypothetical protein COW84_10570 [Gammaproteobacteria bacterium CG22_combo_CG10-13_8_21_14_all_40_8]